MTKLSNGIATRKDCNDLVTGAFKSAPLNRCPYKNEILSTTKFLINKECDDKQLIKYSDLSIAPNFTGVLRVPSVIPSFYRATAVIKSEPREGGEEIMALNITPYSSGSLKDTKKGFKKNTYVIHLTGVFTNSAYKGVTVTIKSYGSGNLITTGNITPLGQFSWTSPTISHSNISAGLGLEIILTAYT